MAHTLLCFHSSRPASRAAATAAGGCLAAVVAVASSGCLLFTDPINMPPTIDGVVATPPQPFHGQNVTVQANVSDQNGDTVILDWARVVGPCTDDVPGPAQRARGQSSYQVTESDTETPFCVWVFATDSHGASVHANVHVDPLDHTPVAAISIVSPNPAPTTFPLYATLEFSGAGSTDLDQTDVQKLAYRWNLVGRPIGSAASLGDCPLVTDAAIRCLTPDQPGTYQVTLVVDDGFPSTSISTSLPASTTVMAVDKFPCLGTTTPPLDASTVFRNFDEPAPFAVANVIDDGGPSGVTHYSWFLGKGTLPADYQGIDFPTFTVDPRTFDPLGFGRVRVEIHDDRNRAAIDLELQGCGDDAVCASSPGCFQRMTWNVEYQ